MWITLLTSCVFFLTIYYTNVTQDIYYKDIRQRPLKDNWPKTICDILFNLMFRCDSLYDVNLLVQC